MLAAIPKLQSGWNCTGHELFYWCQATAEGWADHEILPLLQSPLLRVPGSTGPPGSALSKPSADTLSSRIQLGSQHLEQFCISGPSFQGLPAPHPPHSHPAAVPGSTVPATRTLSPLLAQNSGDLSPKKPCIFSTNFIHCQLPFPRIPFLLLPRCLYSFIFYV